MGRIGVKWNELPFRRLVPNAPFSGHLPPVLSGKHTYKRPVEGTNLAHHPRKVGGVVTRLSSAVSSSTTSSGKGARVPALAIWDANQAEPFRDLLEGYCYQLAWSRTGWRFSDAAAKFTGRLSVTWSQGAPLRERITGRGRRARGGG